MPTDAQVKKNKKYTRRSYYGYYDTAAHEMGHILGLDDAYTYNNEYNDANGYKQIETVYRLTKILKRVTKT